MLEAEELEMLIFIIDDIDPMMYYEDDYQFIQRIRTKLKDMQFLQMAHKLKNVIE